MFKCACAVQTICLMHVQLPVCSDDVFVLSVNFRGASNTYIVLQYNENLTCYGIFVATEYSICHHLGSQQWGVPQEPGAEGGVASGPWSPAGASSLLLPGLLLQSKPSSAVVGLFFKALYVLTAAHQSHASSILSPFKCTAAKLYVFPLCECSFVVPAIYAYYAKC